MKQEIQRSKTVCFTGHRPEKLPDKGDRNSAKTRAIKSMIYQEIYDAAEDGYDTFITGMQRGVDLWAGEAVLDMMSLPGRDLRLIAVLPYEGFGSSFTGEDRWVFGRIIESAQKTVTVCKSYTKDCMARRNRFMVDNSSRIIGVMSSGFERSGAGQTLRYAKSCGLDIRRIDPAAFFASLEGSAGEQLSFDITLYSPPGLPEGKYVPGRSPAKPACGRDTHSVMQAYIDDDDLELP